MFRHGFHICRMSPLTKLLEGRKANGAGRTNTHRYVVPDIQLCSLWSSLALCRDVFGISPLSRIGQFNDNRGMGEG